MPESRWTPPDHFPDISGAKWWSLDVESKDTDLKERGPGYIRGDAYICGVAVLMDGFSGYYPVRHAQGSNLAPNNVFAWLKDQAKTFRGELYGGNLLYDEEALWHEDVIFSDEVRRRDIQIAEPLLDEETAKGYSVEVISQKYLGEGKDEGLLREAAARFSKGTKGRRSIPFDPKKDLWMLPAQYVGQYAEADVDRPRRCYEKQKVLLEKEGLWPVFELESSLAPLLLRMRMKGVRVDLERAEQLKQLMTREIDRYAMEIKSLVGFHPNVNSSADLLKAYEAFDRKAPELGIRLRLKRTAPSKNYPTGQASFDKAWLTDQTDPLSELVRKTRELRYKRDKFIGTDIIQESINGRVHAQFHQLRQDEGGTRSGRFSSSHPNLQQVPKRHDEVLWGKDSPNWGIEIRKLFLPEPGEKMLRSDYSQQEPRLLLHFAGLCHLQGAAEALETFRANPLTDYHSMTQGIINTRSGRCYERDPIKSINLGIMYSMGLDKLCRQLGISVAEGRDILTEYHAAIPFVKGLSTAVSNRAQQRGFILTLLGRKRRFNLWEPRREGDEARFAGLPLEEARDKWPGRQLQRFGLHKALNALIQGSAADQTKKAMQVLYYEHSIVPQLQVHDELVKSVGSVEEARTIKRVMEGCVTLLVPVVCESALGPSWGEKNELVELN